MASLGILYLLFVAVLITLIFALLLRVRGPWGNIWIFFIIILLSVLIAGIYVQPAGPVYREIYWLPPMVVGILIALLLAATTPSPRTRSILSVKEEEKEDEKKKEEADFYTLGIFFWVLFVFMLIILGIGLYMAM